MPSVHVHRGACRWLLSGALILAAYPLAHSQTPDDPRTNIAPMTRPPPFPGLDTPERACIWMAMAEKDQLAPPIRQCSQAQRSICTMARIRMSLTATDLPCDGP